MIRDLLVEIVNKAVTEARDAGEVPVGEMPEITLEPPKNREFGDFSSNVAMVLSRQAKMPPREVAQKVLSHIKTGEGIIERADIAGAGFINFYLKPDWLYDIVRRIAKEGEKYGYSQAGCGKKVQVEFVSANPNGPITVAHGRGGAIGDAIASVLGAAGYDVSRESYINDALNSTQMQNFGRSVHARYLQALGQDYPMPEDGYQGEYVKDIAKDLVDKHGEKFLSIPEEERIVLFTQMAEDEMLSLQKQELAKFGVKHDNWFSERTLHESGKVTKAIETLKERGYAYEKGGAIWLKSTEFGDDKDRALVRSNGQPTYIAADAAYHLDKFNRGFDKVIDVWGPDHHGYIARTKAAVAALGCDPNKLDVLIYQAVRLFSGGEIVMMSKRAGDVILLSELVDEVGKDSARFFFLMRSSDSNLDFDMELAKSQSSDNPVFYVQYAHARICSILRKAEDSGVKVPSGLDVDMSVLTHPAEADLIKKLAELPDLVVEISKSYEIHRLTRYAQDLAAIFHGFYTECRVVSEDEKLTAARLSLVDATRTVLANTLHLLGMSAPEKM
ncbi:MAG TPA: arginine--tRNA ligase [Armatimonadota bacterium]|jgi:arginyl-tRNA synthetase